MDRLVGKKLNDAQVSITSPRLPTPMRLHFQLDASAGQETNVSVEAHTFIISFSDTRSYADRSRCALSLTLLSDSAGCGGSDVEVGGGQHKDGNCCVCFRRRSRVVSP